MTLKIDEPADTPTITMSRTINAPREKVWEVFTNPEHVRQWYGGFGFTNPVCEMDVRPGGRWSHVMRTPEGYEVALEYVFVEVRKPERLVWEGADQGREALHGSATPRVEITLEDLGAQTGWTMVARFASDEQREVARQMGFISVLSEGTQKFDALIASL
ncbi:MAG TPA: SRPBCC domain-containing protein [Brevundimonas sp.]|nr:SRPBCC domain-containing protein [Brevundimonas sp.]